MGPAIWIVVLVAFAAPTSTQNKGLGSTLMSPLPPGLSPGRSERSARNVESGEVPTRFPIIVTMPRSHKNDGRIMFPGPDHDCYPLDSPDCKPMFKIGEELVVPKACENQTYCTLKPTNYPEKKFNDMLKDYKIPPLLHPLPDSEALSYRQGDITYEDDCETEVTYEPLYFVRENREEPWRIVVQAPDRNYIQNVRLEVCTSKPGESCFKSFTSLSPYKSECEQRYNKWEVLVAARDNKGTELVKAELPVCCSCKYKRDDYIFS